MEPGQRRVAARYRSIRFALDAITLPARPREAMPEALAAPEAVAAAGRMRAMVAQPNIVGVGIAEKESDGQLTGELALTFYVEKKHDVPVDQTIPPSVPYALARRDVPTDVVELGPIVPEALAQRTPVTPGFSIGHGDVTAGTLGAILGPRNRPRILGNSHVLADSGEALVGDPILYPGPLDGGGTPDVIAHLDHFVPFDTSGAFVNTMDAAVATIVRERRAEVRTRIALLGVVPTGTTIATRGMKIVKVGRTTGLTRGEVRDVNFRFTLDYGGGIGPVGFVDQVLCTRYSDGGDSGSLVLEEGSGRAVGLHFAGANGGSVFSPIRPVLRAVRGKLISVALNEP